jgi:methionyl aminopeptidase
LITLKSAQEIDMMRQAGQIVGQTLQMLRKGDQAPGITTAQLDALAKRKIESCNANRLFSATAVFPRASVPR